jgi:hypothetical protein
LSRRIVAAGFAMKPLGRLLLTAAACSATVAARPAGAATQTASVNANVVRPLTLVSIQNLDLGTIALQAGTYSGISVGISRAGVFSCSSPYVICTGVTQVAKYNVTGSNKQVVLISAPNVTLVNQADPTKTLTMVVDKPASVTLTNSGQPGLDFALGGTLTLSSSTPTGDYVGTFQVTVNYQ